MGGGLGLFSVSRASSALLFSFRKAVGVGWWRASVRLKAEGKQGQPENKGSERGVVRIDRRSTCWVLRALTGLVETAKEVQ